MQVYCSKLLVIAESAVSSMRTMHGHSSEASELHVRSLLLLGYNLQECGELQCLCVNCRNAIIVHFLSFVVGGTVHATSCDI